MSLLFTDRRISNHFIFLYVFPIFWNKSYSGSNMVPGKTSIMIFNLFLIMTKQGWTNGDSLYYNKLSNIQFFFNH